MLDIGVNDYLSHIENVRRYSRHTIIAYKTDLGQFSEFCKKELLGATRTEVRGFLLSLRAKDCVPSTINRKLEVLRSFYRFHRRFSNYNEYPSSFVKPLRRKKERSNYLTVDQIRDALNTIKPGINRKVIRDKLVLELLYQTGCRSCEIINLRKEDIDFARLQIRVTGKSQVERIVPISKKVARLIEKCLKLWKEKNTGPFLFTNNKGEKMYPMFLWRLIRVYFKKLDTDVEVSAHTFRHSFATHLYHNRAPIKAIRDLLGHRSLRSTSAYLHLDIKIISEIYKNAHPRSGRKRNMI